MYPMHVKRNDLNAKSRMKGDFHVRFRERLRVKFPWSTRHYASKDAFLALVLQERGYETIFEGKRYNDLKRCGKLAEAALAAGRISALSEVGDAAYWWPIPTDEFNYNMALDQTKDQNPGY